MRLRCRRAAAIAADVAGSTGSLASFKGFECGEGYVGVDVNGRNNSMIAKLYVKLTKRIGVSNHIIRPTTYDQKTGLNYVATQKCLPDHKDMWWHSIRGDWIFQIRVH